MDLEELHQELSALQPNQVLASSGVMALQDTPNFGAAFDQLVHDCISNPLQGFREATIATHTLFVVQTGERACHIMLPVEY